jgi:hypothetical protein
VATRASALTDLGGVRKGEKNTGPGQGLLMRQTGADGVSGQVPCVRFSITRVLADAYFEQSCGGVFR